MPAIMVSEWVPHFSNDSVLILEWGSSSALYIIFNYLSPHNLATHAFTAEG